MQATAPGQNRTGTAVNPKGINLMLDAVRDLSPMKPISTLHIDVERQTYITEADSVGSIPPPKMSASGKKSKKKSAANAEAVGTGVLLDKLGERIAFERTGTRLYDALLTKHAALLIADEDPLPPVYENETAAQTLSRIRSEELEHFHLLCDAVKSMGGDPTVQTPCADVTAAASMGLMQVISDPRTTLAQSLNAILTAELTDNAGWELLIALAERSSGRGAMIATFSQALEAEQEHVTTIRDWLQVLVMNEAGTAAV